MIDVRGRHVEDEDERVKYPADTTCSDKPLCRQLRPRGRKAHLSPLVGAINDIFEQLVDVVEIRATIVQLLYKLLGIVGLRCSILVGELRRARAAGK